MEALEKDGEITGLSKINLDLQKSIERQGQILSRNTSHAEVSKQRKKVVPWKENQNQKDIDYEHILSTQDL